MAARVRLMHAPLRVRELLRDAGGHRRKLCARRRLTRLCRLHTRRVVRPHSLHALLRARRRRGVVTVLLVQLRDERLDAALRARRAVLHLRTRAAPRHLAALARMQDVY